MLRLDEKPTAPAACAYPVEASVMADLGILQMLMPMEGHDEAGRALLEGRSLIDPPGPENYQQCRYRGCRRLHDNPMNVGALRIYMDNRAAVNGWLWALSAEQLDLPPGSRLLFAAHAGYHAPKLWLTGCQPGPVPPYIATAAKISHGVYELALDVVRLKGFAWLETADSHTLALHSEEHARLIGRREVCAGPPDVIETVLAILAGACKPIGTSDRELASQAGFARLISDAGHLFWCLERLAITQTLYRMTLAKGDPQIKVTFPNVLTVIDSFMRRIPLRTTFVSAYQNYPPSREPDLNSANSAIDLFSVLWRKKLRTLTRPDLVLGGCRQSDLVSVMTKIHDLSLRFGFRKFTGFTPEMALKLLF